MALLCCEQGRPKFLCRCLETNKASNVHIVGLYNRVLLDTKESPKSFSNLCPEEKDKINVSFSARIQLAPALCQFTRR